MSVSHLATIAGTISQSLCFGLPDARRTSDVSRDEPRLAYPNFRHFCPNSHLNTTDPPRGQGVAASRCSGGKGEPSRPHSTPYGHNTGSISPLSRRRWIPPSSIRRDAQEPPHFFDKKVDYKVRSILNKITPEKFDKLSHELLDLGLESEDVLKRVLLLIFNKALDDYKYSCMYAKLCKVINENLSRYYEKLNSKNIFKYLLLSKCKEEFENRRKAFEVFENHNGPLNIDEEEQRQIARQKMLGNIKFICELGKQNLLPKNILYDCIKQLLSKKKNQSFKDKTQDLECLCEIMKNIGDLLDENDEASCYLDQFFVRMDMYSKHNEINSRIRFMLLDVIDLRKNNWIPRQKESLLTAVTDTVKEKESDVFPQYGFPFMRPNMNMKSARYDDVFSQFNIGPYYLGTGPGAINDISHLPSNQRRSNFPTNNFSRTPNFTPGNVNNGAKRDNYRQNNQQSSSSSGSVGSFPSNVMSNGLNHRSTNRERDREREANLPPRLQKQQNTIAPFQALIKSDGDRQNKAYKLVDKNSFKQAQSFATNKPPNAFTKMTNLPRQPINGKETALIHDLNQLKVHDKPAVEAENNSINVNAEIEKHLNDYFQSENPEPFIAFFKTLTINFDEVMLLIMRISIGKSEKERDLASKLINKIKTDSVVAEGAFIVSLKKLFCKISELEVETPRARSYVAAYVSNIIIEDVLSLKDVGDLLEGGQHYPLFPLILQNLHKAKDQSWLFDAFTESKINLMNMLPENDRNKERMADILEDRNLTFLYPMLRIESDITRQITSDCSPTSLYRWLKDNVNPALQTSPEFISVVFTTLLKHIIAKHNNPDNLNSFTNVHFANQETELKKYSQVLQVFLAHKQDLQLVVLYSLQTYCHDINFPKGLVEKWFNMLYELEIVDEEVFFKWREDINDEYPGKGKALFQVNKWLTWLEEEDEDEEE